MLDTQLKFPYAQQASQASYRESLHKRVKVSSCMVIAAQPTGTAVPAGYWFEDVSATVPDEEEPEAADAAAVVAPHDKPGTQQQQSAPPGVTDVTVQLLRKWVPFAISETLLTQVQQRLQAEAALGADGAIVREVLFLQFGR